MIKNSHIKNWILIILKVFLVSHLAVSQNYSSDSVSRKISLGVNLYGGVLIPHYKLMELFREQHPVVIEIKIGVKDFGSKPWHTFYRFPEYGVSYMFMDLGSPNYLGYAHSLYPYISIPINPHNHRIFFSSGWGVGIGYITKTYHRTNNFKNQAISTHLNYAINLGIDANIRINHNFNAHWSLNLMHYSNGTHRKPNSGLNYFFSSIGASMLIDERKQPVLQLDAPDERRGRLLALGAGSLKEELGVGGPNYWVGALSLEYSYPFLSHLRGGVTFDSMFDDSRQIQFYHYGLEYSGWKDILQFGTSLHCEVIFQRLSAGFYLGRYLHNVGELRSKNYQRLGLRYRITNKLWAHLMLKTHLQIADYVEYGLAVKLF